MRLVPAPGEQTSTTERNKSGTCAFDPSPGAVALRSVKRRLERRLERRLAQVKIGPTRPKSEWKRVTRFRETRRATEKRATPIKPGAENKEKAS